MRAQRLLAALQFWHFMAQGADKKDRLYLSEFISVSFYPYLENIAVMCRLKAYIVKSLAPCRCGAIFRSYC